MSEKILAGRYKLVEQIGIGGMAIVYRAIDTRTGHNVAVKVLKPEFNQDVEFVSRFQREAEAASKMTHHNIVNLLDVGMDGSNRYLVMEYVNGKTLKDIIKEKGRLSCQAACQITIRILSALQHAHSKGIIHRDIKPQNILIDKDGHVKVADFGIARIANSSTLSKSDSVMGSVHYFSPEQASGHTAVETSDIYSVGVVMYEMLTGRVPFDGDSAVAIAMQHLNAAPTPIEVLAPDCPPAIIHICMVAMEKNPAYRYPSAKEMAMQIHMAMNGQYAPMPVRSQDTQAPVILNTGSYPSSLHNTGGNRFSGTGPMGGTGPGGVSGGKARRSRGATLFTVVFAILLTAAIIAGTTAIIDRVTNYTTVADVVGLDASAAERALTRSGLNAQIVEVNSATVSVGLVLTQTPEADRSLRRGDTVTLTVSKGPGTQMVPQVTGQTVTDAIAALQVPGLTLAVIERVPSSDMPVDVIISQSPEAGATCQQGGIVQVTVSGGSAYVPNLMEMTLPEADEALRAAGLFLNSSIQYELTDNQALHGHVGSQLPAPGSQVVSGAGVTVTLYRSPALTHTASAELSLPESTSTLSVRVTLTENNTELPVWQGDVTPDSSRHPVVEFTTDSAGSFTFRVYINDDFLYQQQIVTQ